MDKRKRVTYIFASCAMLTAMAVFAANLTLSWFLAPQADTDEKVIDGEIGLRSYFYGSNNGNSEVDSYEIVSPEHLYNLSRLQNLGVFENAKKYFRIGHYFTSEETGGKPGYYCIDGKDESGNPKFCNYLDLSNFTGIIEPIGSESTPFVGYFNGNNIPVRNLHVYGTPEDIGVFGYVAYGGRVKNLICDGLTITSRGYSATHLDESNMLYSETIDPLFDNASTSYFKTAQMHFVDAGGGSTPLKTNATSSRSTFSNFNAASNLEDDYYKGYFVADWPTYTKPASDWPNKDPMSYSLICSTSLLRVQKQTFNVEVDGVSTEVEKDIVKMDIKPLADSWTEAGETKPAKSRISILATIEKEGVLFSRVIQSYTLTFDPNSKPWSAGEAILTVDCDYISSIDAVPYLSPNYHHGNNIGFLAGHVDGIIDECYVYNSYSTANSIETCNGGLDFNPSSQGAYTSIRAESDVGLVGEVGDNVRSNLNPQEAMGKGERGIMNISGIYDNIRTPFSPGDNNYAGTWEVAGKKKKLISYYDNKSDYYPLYEKYVRVDETVHKNPVTTAESVSSGFPAHPYSESSSYTIPANAPAGISSVDFKPNVVIEEGTETVTVPKQGGGTEEVEAERGLGVFKIVSSYASSVNLITGLGECNIMKGEEKTDVFFSTAECDWTNTASGTWQNVGVSPLRMTTLPTSYDMNSFKYPFSRDFNYVFRLDLSDSYNVDETPDYYMSNSTSGFLKNYLSSILIDEDGAPVGLSSYKLGFMFRARPEKDAEGNVTAAKALKSLSSYLTVGKPSAVKSYTLDDGAVRSYPPDSIVFHIDNVNGANVSVVGNNADISIYSFDSTNASTPIRELYTMKSQNADESYMHRYFEYTYAAQSNLPEEGFTGETVEVLPDGTTDKGVLYGHIFKLTEPGDYVIGAATKSNLGNRKANIYYLAVQGQEAGDVGDSMTHISESKANVDFLLEAPLAYDSFSVLHPKDLPSIPVVEESSSSSEPIVSIDVLNKAKFSFNGYFDNTPGLLSVGAYTEILEQEEEEESSEESVEESSGGGGEEESSEEEVIPVRICMKITFSSDGSFTTYLLAYCQDTSPYYIIGDRNYNTVTGKFPPSSP